MSDAVVLGVFAAMAAIIPAGIAAYVQIWLKKHVGNSNGDGTLHEALHVIKKEVRRLSIAQAHGELSNDIKFSAIFEHLGMKPPTTPSSSMIQELVRQHEEDQEASDGS